MFESEDLMLTYIMYYYILAWKFSIYENFPYNLTMIFEKKLWLNILQYLWYMLLNLSLLMLENEAKIRTIIYIFHYPF